jgi:hypothetical protein
MVLGGRLMDPIRRANLTPLLARVHDTDRATLRVRLLYSPRPDARITLPAEILELSNN